MGERKSMNRYFLFFFNNLRTECGGPGRNRTPNLGLRRSLLYPVELRGRYQPFAAARTLMQGCES